MRLPDNYIGKRFARLVGLSQRPKDKRTWVTCVCDCGSIVEVQGKKLKNGHTRSCGCLRREVARQRPNNGLYHQPVHGESNAGGKHPCSPEYRAWANMIHRCENPKTSCYERYGGRGITVCERWRTSYRTFLSDMGRKPTPKHSIDRIHNDGNYEPGNCRWATKEQQSRNVGNNRLLTFNGRTMIEKDWARETGIGYCTLRHRLRRLGWSVERTLTQPVRPIARRGA